MHKIDVFYLDGWSGRQPVFPRPKRALWRAVLRIAAGHGFNRSSRGPQRTLVHGIVAHGFQLLSPALRHEPTSYYARLKSARVVKVQEDVREYRGHSVWVLLAGRSNTLDRRLGQERGGLRRTPAWLHVWTDEYSNLFQLLK